MWVPDKYFPSLSWCADKCFRTSLWCPLGDSLYSLKCIVYSLKPLMATCRKLWCLREDSYDFGRVFCASVRILFSCASFEKYMPTNATISYNRNNYNFDFPLFSGQTHLHPSVFPLLLLLSHLYSSSMDGNDSKMKLSAFVPHIIRFVLNYSNTGD